MRQVWQNIILPILAFLGFLLMVSVCGVIEAEGQPYDRDFTVVRTVNVTPTDLLATLSAAQPGDQLVMADGNYSGNITMDRVNVMLFCPGHCVLNGTVKLQGQNTWLVGLEIIANAGNFVEMQAPDTVVMGCVIHGQGAIWTVGILATNWPNQLIAFNTIFDVQHGLYLQNTLPANKWIVGNYIADVILPPDNNARTIHAYSESANKMEGMRFIKNITRNGQFLIGGQVNATPPIDNSIDEHLAFKSDLVLGYKRPEDTDVTSSIFLRSRYDSQWFWGEGEQVYTPTPITVTGNKFFNPTGTQVLITTSAYTPNRVQCSPKLRTTDTFDNNEYYGGFKNALCANGVNDVVVQPLSFWHTKTTNAGKKLDANSTSSSSAPANGYKLIQNEWDPNKATLAVWAFDGAATVSVTLPNSGNVFQATNPYGTPVVAGNSGLNSIPIIGEFAVYAVKYSGPPPPQCNLDEVDSRLAEAMTILNDPALTATKARRQAKKKVQEAKNLLTPCL